MTLLSSVKAKATDRLSETLVKKKKSKAITFHGVKKSLSSKRGGKTLRVPLDTEKRELGTGEQPQEKRRGVLARLMGKKGPRRSALRDASPQSRRYHMNLRKGKKKATYFCLISKVRCRDRT